MFDFSSIEGLKVKESDSPLKTSCVYFSAEKFHRLQKFEDHSFWFRCRDELIGWAFKKYFNKWGDFLEIGCGNGVVINHLEKVSPHVDFMGLDLFIEGLLFCRQRLGRLILVQMDIMSPGFRSPFDVVGMFDVLEHIPDDEKALQNIFGLLRSGGLILTVPKHPWLWSPIDEIAYHKRRYSRGELSRKLREAGFEVIIITSFMSLLLPAMIVSRFFKKRLKMGQATFSEFEIPDKLNRVFYKTCAVDRYLIEAGLSLPVGGSLLAVACKPV